MLWEIGWWCSGGLRPCSSGSSAVPTPDRDEDDGVALGSGDFGKLFPLAAALASPPFFLFSLFSLGSGVLWTATRWRRGTGERSGIRGQGFITELHAPMASGDRAVERRAMHQTARVRLRERGAREIGPCPGRDPLVRPATVVGARSRERLGVGVEKTTLWTGVADMRGQVAAAVRRKRRGARAWATWG